MYVMDRTQLSFSMRKIWFIRVFDEIGASVFFLPLTFASIIGASFRKKGIINCPDVEKLHALRQG